jgi:hypothetical protein
MSAAAVSGREMAGDFDGRFQAALRTSAAGSFANGATAPTTHATHRMARARMKMNAIIAM